MFYNYSLSRSLSAKSEMVLNPDFDSREWSVGYFVIPTFVLEVASSDCNYDSINLIWWSKCSSGMSSNDLSEEWSPGITYMPTTVVSGTNSYWIILDLSPKFYMHGSVSIYSLNRCNFSLGSGLSLSLVLKMGPRSFSWAISSYCSKDPSS